ncbi:hypothetical protein D9613_011128 [Agrocybe pediades]|uniref:Protein farnesyltransferase/geranylgeranyltransferase type-1 subunit alpha n=1 Tax=Agrocybe pediades TaxID=84607 RepID=A0A8H4QLS8_9AGAR|nr:hypothetical protein D9613_011128 [Agrocybe pediades]
MPPIQYNDDEPLYSERPEWSDVQPLEQYENITPLAPIFYSPEYKDATGYLRAVVKSGEKSQRVLGLTESVIRMNPAHYSAWQYRYETLVALIPSDFKTPSTINSPDPLPQILQDEIKLLDQLSTAFLKTYQVWHHRRLLLLLTRQAGHELNFIKKGLIEVDEKNYHTWSYRQWILGSFGGLGGGGTDESGDWQAVDEDLWVGELDFVDMMLAQDVRNNSAWHHRFFVVWGCGVRDGEEDRERVLKRELIYAKQNISLAPNNPSAWNYLRGVLTHTKTPFSPLLPFAIQYIQPLDFGGNEGSGQEPKGIVDLENPPPSETAQLPCVQAMEFVADAWEADALQGDGDQEKLKRAVKVWERLATEHDVIRNKYWEHRIRDAHVAMKKL